MKALQFWIEVEIGPDDNVDDYEIRTNVIRRRGLDGYHSQKQGLYRYLYELSVPLDKDPRAEAMRVVQALRGYAAVLPLPQQIRNLLDEETPDREDDPYVEKWFPPGALSVHKKMTRLDEEEIYGDALAVLHIYLRKVARVQLDRKLRMDGDETLGWIIDHWELGDQGCAEALDQRRKPRGKPRKRPRKSERSLDHRLANIEHRLARQGRQRGQP